MPNQIIPDASQDEFLEDIGLLLILKVAKYPGGPLEWQEGVSGSSMDLQKAP